MTKDIQEAFEKTRNAGAIASDSLDEVAHFIKPGVTTNQIDSLLTITVPILPLFTTEVFLNLLVLQ